MYVHCRAARAAGTAAVLQCPQWKMMHEQPLSRCFLLSVCKCDTGHVIFAYPSSTIHRFRLSLPHSSRGPPARSSFSDSDYVPAYRREGVLYCSSNACASTTSSRFHGEESRFLSSSHTSSSTSSSHSIISSSTSGIHSSTSSGRSSTNSRHSSTSSSHNRDISCPSSSGNSSRTSINSGDSSTSSRGGGFTSSRRVYSQTNDHRELCCCSPTSTDSNFSSRLGYYQKDDYKKICRCCTSRSITNELRRSGKPQHRCMSCCAGIPIIRKSCSSRGVARSSSSCCCVCCCLEKGNGLSRRSEDGPLSNSQNIRSSPHGWQCIQGSHHCCLHYNCVPVFESLYLISPRITHGSQNACTRSVPFSAATAVSALWPLSAALGSSIGTWLLRRAHPPTCREAPALSYNHRGDGGRRGSSQQTSAGTVSAHSACALLRAERPTRMKFAETAQSGRAAADIGAANSDLAVVPSLRRVLLTRLLCRKFYSMEKKYTSSSCEVATSSAEPLPFSLCRNSVATVRSCRGIVFFYAVTASRRAMHHITSAATVRAAAAAALKGQYECGAAEDVHAVALPVSEEPSNKAPATRDKDFRESSGALPGLEKSAAALKTSEISGEREGKWWKISQSRRTAGGKGNGDEREAPASAEPEERPSRCYAGGAATTVGERHGTDMRGYEDEGEAEAEEEYVSVEELFVNPLCMQVEQRLLQCESAEDVLTLLVSHRGVLFVKNLVTALELLADFVGEAPDTPATSTCSVSGSSSSRSSRNDNRNRSSSSNSKRESSCVVTSPEGRQRKGHGDERRSSARTVSSNTTPDACSSTRTTDEIRFPHGDNNNGYEGQGTTYTSETNLMDQGLLGRCLNGPVPRGWPRDKMTYRELFSYLNTPHEENSAASSARNTRGAVQALSQPRTPGSNPTSLKGQSEAAWVVNDARYEVLMDDLRFHRRSLSFEAAARVVLALRRLNHRHYGLLSAMLHPLAKRAIPLPPPAPLTPATSAATNVAPEPLLPHTLSTCLSGAGSVNPVSESPSPCLSAAGSMTPPCASPWKKASVFVLTPPTQTYTGVAQINAGTFVSSEAPAVSLTTESRKSVSPSSFFSSPSAVPTHFERSALHSQQQEGQQQQQLQSKDFYEAGRMQKRYEQATHRRMQQLLRCADVYIWAGYTQHPFFDRVAQLFWAALGPCVHEDIARGLIAAAEAATNNRDRGAPLTATSGQSSVSSDTGATAVARSKTHSPAATTPIFRHSAVENPPNVGAATPTDSLVCAARSCPAATEAPSDGVTSHADSLVSAIRSDSSETASAGDDPTSAGGGFARSKVSAAFESTTGTGSYTDDATNIAMAVVGGNTEEIGALVRVSAYKPPHGHATATQIGIILANSPSLLVDCLRIFSSLLVSQTEHSHIAAAAAQLLLSNNHRLLLMLSPNDAAALAAAVAALPPLLQMSPCMRMQVPHPLLNSLSRSVCVARLQQQHTVKMHVLPPSKGGEAPQQSGKDQTPLGSHARSHQHPDAGEQQWHHPHQEKCEQQQQHVDGTQLLDKATAPSQDGHANTQRKPHLQCMQRTQQKKSSKAFPRTARQSPKIDSQGLAVNQGDSQIDNQSHRRLCGQGGGELLVCTEKRSQRPDTWMLPNSTAVSDEDADGFSISPLREEVLSSGQQTHASKAVGGKVVSSGQHIRTSKALGEKVLLTRKHIPSEAFGEERWLPGQQIHTSEASGVSGTVLPSVDVPVTESRQAPTPAPQARVGPFPTNISEPVWWQQPSSLVHALLWATADYLERQFAIFSLAAITTMLAAFQRQQLLFPLCILRTAARAATHLRLAANTRQDAQLSVEEVGKLLHACAFFGFTTLTRPATTSSVYHEIPSTTPNATAATAAAASAVAAPAAGASHPPALVRNSSNIRASCSTSSKLRKSSLPLLTSSAAFYNDGSTLVIRKKTPSFLSTHSYRGDLPAASGCGEEWVDGADTAVVRGARGLQLTPHYCTTDESTCARDGLLRSNEDATSEWDVAAAASARAAEETSAAASAVAALCDSAAAYLEQRLDEIEEKTAIQVCFALAAVKGATSLRAWCMQRGGYGAPWPDEVADVSSLLDRMHVRHRAFARPQHGGPYEIDILLQAPSLKNTALLVTTESARNSFEPAGGTALQQQHLFLLAGITRVACVNRALWKSLPTRACKMLLLLQTLQWLRFWAEKKSTSAAPESTPTVSCATKA